jgi:hypothetical protein
VGALTSYPEEASMWIPLELKYFRIAALGQAFIAYRTVNPNALGNAKHESEDSFNFARE